MTLATGNAQPQFILSTANIANVEQQAMIQQLLRQSALIVGCNSLLVTSNAGPAQTVQCVTARTAGPATVKTAANDDSKVTGNHMLTLMVLNMHLMT